MDDSDCSLCGSSGSPDEEPICWRNNREGGGGSQFVNQPVASTIRAHRKRERESTESVCEPLKGSEANERRRG